MTRPRFPSQAQRRQRARARRDRLDDRTRMTTWRSVVRARDDGVAGKMSLVLAAEILPMAILGIPSGGGRPAPRVADDDARRRSHARADPRVVPFLYASGHLTFPSSSGSSPCSAPSHRRTSRPRGRSCLSSSARTNGACRRRTARSKGYGVGRSHRAGSRRPPHPVPRRRERASTSTRRPTSLRSCSSCLFVPAGSRS